MYGHSAVNIGFNKPARGLLPYRDVRIAMISTPFVPVPPPCYGGTELVVAELVEGLAAAGHEVTLFATGDSHAPADVRALVPTAQWPPDPARELEHAAWAIEQILDERGFDIVHAHVPSALRFARFLQVPLVYTLHDCRDEQLVQLYRGCRAQPIAISARQRDLCPEAEGAVVIHHGVSPSRYPLGRGRAGYAAFLGRLSGQKGVHVAIDVARAAGVPLEIAGRPHWCDSDYHEMQVAPRLGPGVKLIGEVGGAQKARFLGEAMALLFPIQWEEPFGLVMIEAMLCGTPVLGLPRGSVPEVIDDGVTGFVCADADEMMARLRQIAAGRFDRGACRARALARFTAQRMVSEHLQLYSAVCHPERIHARAAAPTA
jgi:glycosyltransferase involved in cell wall biosynthesis